MAQSTAQGRFSVLSAPRAIPGKCGICGYGGSERQYLDTLLNFDFYGALIFCEICVNEMARKFGLIETAQARRLEQRVEEAERELITLRATTANLENLRVSLDALGISSSVLGDGNLASGGTKRTDEFSSTPINAEGSDNREDAESSDESGPDDLRDSKPSYDPFADLR